jgi:hypothetical protein
MGTEISSEFQVTNEEFEMLQEALQDYRKRCLSYASNCRKSYSGKVSTEMKAKEWIEKADFCTRIETKIAYEFI